MPRYPDFFVVGAAKSGTTAIWKYLSTIPGIYMTKDIREKELGFFSNGYGLTNLNEYLSFFSGAKPNEIIGESCHAYLTSVESAEMIKSSVRNAKIIISLRNPAKRAFSLYSWMVMHGYENKLSFEEALQVEQQRISDPNFIKRPPHPYLKNFEYYGTGFYFQQVKRYFDVFGQENVRVLIFEEFIKHENRKIVFELVKFLGIDTDITPIFTRENESFKVKDVSKQFFLRQTWERKLKGYFFSRYFADHLLNFQIGRAHV
mgnify:FL=1